MTEGTFSSVRPAFPLSASLPTGSGQAADRGAETADHAALVASATPLVAGAFWPPAHQFTRGIVF